MCSDLKVSDNQEINNDSRCNIPVNAVAHRKHKLRERDSSLQKQAAKMELVVIV